MEPIIPFKNIPPELDIWMREGEQEVNKFLELMSTADQKDFHGNSDSPESVNIKRRDDILTQMESILSNLSRAATTIRGEITKENRNLGKLQEDPSQSAHEQHNPQIDQEIQECKKKIEELGVVEASTSVLIDRMYGCINSAQDRGKSAETMLEDAEEWRIMESTMTRNHNEKTEFPIISPDSFAAVPKEIEEWLNSIEIHLDEFNKRQSAVENNIGEQSAEESFDDFYIEKRNTALSDLYGLYEKLSNCVEPLDKEIELHRKNLISLNEKARKIKQAEIRSDLEMAITEENHKLEPLVLLKTRLMTNLGRLEGFIQEVRDKMDEDTSEEKLCDGNAQPNGTQIPVDDPSSPPPDPTLLQIPPDNLPPPVI